MCQISVAVLIVLPISRLWTLSHVMDLANSIIHTLSKYVWETYSALTLRGRQGEKWKPTPPHRKHGLEGGHMDVSGVTHSYKWEQAL